MVASDNAVVLTGLVSAGKYGVEVYSTDGAKRMGGTNNAIDLKRLFGGVVVTTKRGAFASVGYV